jgi:hypothetical protein
MGISDLLKGAKPEDFQRKELPAADYLVQIVEAEPLPVYWKPNPSKGRGATYALAYTPKLKIIDVLLPGDPELDEEIKAQLERFGDWKGWEFRFTQMQEVPGHEKKILCSGISPVNFMLAECQVNWEGVKEYSRGLPRFYTSSDKNGNQAGFVADKLSASPTEFVPINLPDQDDSEPLPKVIEATIGAYFIATLGFEVDPTGQYPDKLTIKEVSSV